MSLLLLMAILATIFAVVYIVSPIDFLPDVIPGLGLSDDLFVILLAVALWFLYFAHPILIMLIYFAVGIAIIVGLVYVLVWLYRRAYKK